MSYKQYGLIEASDYNTYVGTTTSVVANTLNTVNSAGTKQYGYGQSAITQVAIGAKVSSAQWNSLINKISNLAKHQGSTVTPVTLTASGNPIAATVTTSPVTSIFQNNLDTIYANSGNAIAQGTGTTTPTVNASSWYNHAGFTHVITFVTGDAARYFFNAGGQIALNFVHPAGNSSDNLWNALAIASGKIVLSSPTTGSVSIAGSSYTGITQVGGAGTASTLLTAAGYHSLSTTEQVVFKKSTTLPDASGPTVGQISVSIKSNGTRGVSGDSGNIITITTKWDRIPEGFATDGTFPSAGTAVNVTVTPPATTYLTNTWGTPTVVGTVMTGIDSVVSAPVVTATWDTNPITVPGSATLSWTATNATYVRLGTKGATQYPVNGSLPYQDLGPKRYTYSDGFSQEFDIVGSNAGDPLWIAERIGTKFFESTDAFITTGGGTRYGLFRYPEPDGIVAWLNFCTNNSISDPVTSQQFIDAFFITTLGATAISGNLDSERSFQASKVFNPGDAFGNFVTRPPNSGWWGIDPYSYKFGWVQEFPQFVTNIQLAKKIADTFYAGQGAFTPANLGTRYALYRKPDAAGLANWVDWCLTPSRNNTGGPVLTPETNQTFINNFFNLGDGGDLERSKLQTKPFDEGGGFGNFYDRPLLDPSKMFNRSKTFTETITAVGPGGTTTITL